MRVRKLAQSSLNVNRAQIQDRITSWAFDLRLRRGVSPNFQPQRASLTETNPTGSNSFEQKIKSHQYALFKWSLNDRSLINLTLKHFCWTNHKRNSVVLMTFQNTHKLAPNFSCVQGLDSSYISLQCSNVNLVGKLNQPKCL